MSWFGKDKDDVLEAPEVEEKKDPNAWEFLEDEEDFNTWRRRVPGGWLVRTMESYQESEALVFLPDPNHEWRP